LVEPLGGRNSPADPPRVAMASLGGSAAGGSRQTRRRGTAAAATAAGAAALLLAAARGGGGGGAGGFVAARAGQAPEAEVAPRRGSLLACRAVPLREAEGYGKLKIFDPEVLESLGDFEAFVPQPEDVAGIAGLLTQSFKRIFGLMEEGGMFGFFAEAANNINLNGQTANNKASLQSQLRSGFAKPSVERPRGRIADGNTVSLVLLEKDGPRSCADRIPAAYVSLCLHEADGTRPEGGGIFYLRPDCRPYLLSLCVDPERRRSGLGKKLIRLSESIVKNVWESKVMYLHSDYDPAASNFYDKEGYLQTSLPSPLDWVHRSKELAAAEEEAPEVAGEEAVWS